MDSEHGPMHGMGNFKLGRPSIRRMPPGARQLADPTAGVHRLANQLLDAAPRVKARYDRLLSAAGPVGSHAFCDLQKRIFFRAVRGDAEWQRVGQQYEREYKRLSRAGLINREAMLPFIMRLHRIFPELSFG